MAVQCSFYNFTFLCRAALPGLTGDVVVAVTLATFWAVLVSEPCVSHLHIHTHFSCFKRPLFTELHSFWKVKQNRNFKENTKWNKISNNTEFQNLIKHKIWRKLKWFIPYVSSLDTLTGQYFPSSSLQPHSLSGTHLSPLRMRPLSQKHPSTQCSLQEPPGPAGSWQLGWGQAGPHGL